jgi:hypothetical protein
MTGAPRKVFRLAVHFYGVVLMAMAWESSAFP